jgi:hypothetical protein
MGCCKKVKIPTEQDKIVQAVRRANRATRSNRVPAGTVTKICTNCFTKTISTKCQVCGSTNLKSS